MLKTIVAVIVKHWYSQIRSFDLSFFQTCINKLIAYIFRSCLYKTLGYGLNFIAQIFTFLLVFLHLNNIHQAK